MTVGPILCEKSDTVWALIGQFGELLDEFGDGFSIVWCFTQMPLEVQRPKTKTCGYPQWPIVKAQKKDEIPGSPKIHVKK